MPGIIIILFMFFIGITNNLTYVHMTADKKPVISKEVPTGSGLPEKEQNKIKQLFMPSFSFNLKKAPPAPDYRMLDTWAALPFEQDEADFAPPNTAFPEAQAQAPVDVFFVHPTGYSSKESWNAPWDDAKAAKETSGMMEYCASVFNAAGKVYAPRYRQATVYSFLDKEDFSGIKALDLAYSDVEHAFSYYMEFYNRGRPFILAGHSQGNFHLFRLIQEKIVGTALDQRLVAAYLIGYSVPEKIPGIEPSRNATDTGTIIGWNSYLEGSNHSFFTKYSVIWLDGYYQKISNRPIVQINPLSWKLHGEEVPAEKNLGSLPIAEPEDKIPELVPKVTGADASGEVLIITKPNIPGFPGLGPDMPILNADFGDYHNYDYQLFYENIRKNAVDRTKAFLKK